MTAASSDEPVLRVVRGHPTEAELAALVTVLAHRRASATGTTTSGVRRGDWVAYWRHAVRPTRGPQGGTDRGGRRPVRP